MKATTRDDRLPVEKIIREFEESEAKPGHRKDAFKIDVPFDEAPRRIAKVKPEPRPSGKKPKPRLGNARDY